MIFTRFLDVQVFNHHESIPNPDACSDYMMEQPPLPCAVAPLLGPLRYWVSDEYFHWVPASMSAPGQFNWRPGLVSIFPPVGGAFPSFLTAFIQVGTGICKVVYFVGDLYFED